MLWTWKNYALLWWKFFVSYSTSLISFMRDPLLDQPRMIVAFGLTENDHQILHSSD